MPLLPLESVRTVPILARTSLNAANVSHGHGPRGGDGDGDGDGEGDVDCTHCPLARGETFRLGGPLIGATTRAILIGKQGMAK